MSKAIVAASDVGAGDARWATTLPHLVAPLRDEWLPGLLLRCDAANGWPSDTTAKMVTNGRRIYRSPRAFVVAVGIDLQKLAALIAQPVVAIAETTYAPALQDLFLGLPQKPPYGQGLAIVKAWRVCPDCVAERHFLGRFLVLPLVDHCPHHGTLLVSECPCGASIVPFVSDYGPFTCGQCGRPWGTLPRTRPDTAGRYRGEQAWQLYDYFFTRRNPALVETARDIAWALIRRGFRDLPALVRWPLAGLSERTKEPWRRPLHELVECLAFFGIGPTLLDEQDAPVAPLTHCTNTACGLVGQAGAGNIHSSPIGRRYESWCDRCGSRYLDHRMYWYHGHDGDRPGENGPSPESIVFARAVDAGMTGMIEMYGLQGLLWGRYSFGGLYRRLSNRPEYWLQQANTHAIFDHFTVLGLAVPQRVWCEYYPKEQPRSIRDTFAETRWPHDPPMLSDRSWEDLASHLPLLTDPEMFHVYGDSRAAINTVRFIVYSGPIWRPLPTALPSATNAIAALQIWQRRLSTDAWSELSNVWMDLMPGDLAKRRPGS